MSNNAGAKLDAGGLKAGRVGAIAGHVIDVEFPPDGIPEINNALEVDIILEGDTITVTAEVALVALEIAAVLGHLMCQA